jgi:hypothetical protein
MLQVSSFRYYFGRSINCNTLGAPIARTIPLPFKTSPTSLDVELELSACPGFLIPPNEGPTIPSSESNAPKENENC